MLHVLKTYRARSRLPGLENSACRVQPPCNPSPRQARPCAGSCGWQSATSSSSSLWDCRGGERPSCATSSNATSTGERPRLGTRRTCRGGRGHCHPCGSGPCPTPHAPSHNAKHALVLQSPDGRVHHLSLLSSANRDMYDALVVRCDPAPPPHSPPYMVSLRFMRIPMYPPPPPPNYRLPLLPSSLFLTPSPSSPAGADGRSTDSPRFPSYCTTYKHIACLRRLRFAPPCSLQAGPQHAALQRGLLPPPAEGGAGGADGGLLRLAQRGG